MQDIVIYSSRYCPFCIRAIQLLKSKGLRFREISVDGDPRVRAQMAEKAGSRSVPQIWIGKRHIGGCDQLVALERSGELDKLLAA